MEKAFENKKWREASMYCRPSEGPRCTDSDCNNSSILFLYYHHEFVLFFFEY